MPSRPGTGMPPRQARMEVDPRAWKFILGFIGVVVVVILLASTSTAPSGRVGAGDRRGANNSQQLPPSVAANSYLPTVVIKAPVLPTATAAVPVLPLPNTGVMALRTKRARPAPFRVSTRSGSNFFGQLVDVRTEKAIMTVFIRGGETLSTKVPLGNYRFKYCSGNEWYGKSALFGARTSCNDADAILDFYETADGIYYHELELWTQVGGNLSTDSISPQTFLASLE